MAEIRVENLNKAFGEFIAVRGESFTIPDGSFFCLLGTLIFFREPEREPGETAPTSFGKVLRDMLLVFRNGRFVGFLVIFSGFFIMFWQIFYSLPFYLTESLHFGRFELIDGAFHGGAADAEAL